MKHLVQTKIKTAYNCYLQSILGLKDDEGNTDTDSDKQTFAPKKKLFSLIKNARQDSNGVYPLKDLGTTFSQNIDKASILNKQFQSGFFTTFSAKTQSDMLR